MAGGWIKMRADLDASAEVVGLAGACGLSRAEAVLKLYQLACWFERHGDYGKMNIEVGLIDEYLGVPGLSDRLASIDWLQSHDGVLVLKGFCEVSAGRKSLGKALRYKILHGARCAACGATEDLVIDHIVPIVRGGSCEESNLQALCAPCNRAKGRRTMAEFMAERRAA